MLQQVINGHINIVVLVANAVFQLNNQKLNCSHYFGHFKPSDDPLFKLKDETFRDMKKENV